MGASAEHSHYKTLGLAPQAEPEAVRRAYRRQAQRCHPDKAPGDARAEARMACINEAYAVLSHPERRASNVATSRSIAGRASPISVASSSANSCG